MKEGKRFITDGKNLIIDLKLKVIKNAAEFAFDSFAAAWLYRCFDVYYFLYLFIFFQ